MQIAPVNSLLPFYPIKRNTVNVTSSIAKNQDYKTLHHEDRREVLKFYYIEGFNEIQPKE